MISVVTLGRKYWLAGEILNTYPEIVGTYPSLVAKITAPLSPLETSVVTSVGAEARSVVGTFRGMVAKGRFLEDSFFEGMPGPPLRAAFVAGGFRANATLNESFRFFNELLVFMAKSPKEVLDGHQALLCWR